MYTPKYIDWTESDYVNSDLRYCEPMTAHALEDENEQDNLLCDSNYIIEEKFDGTRGILHFVKGGCRIFSRRISKKTNWFTENSDSLPQMRDLNIPELSGTVIDGEMFIPNRPFKDVSSTLNCIWDKAIERQKELGDIVFHTFDILYYRGIRIEHLSLRRRKVFLRKVMSVLESRGIKCIVEVPYFMCGKYSIISVDRPKELWQRIKGFSSKYPTLYKNIVDSKSPLHIDLTPRGYYEFIVSKGGEGVIIKDLKGKYEHKRSKGFLKIKKFYTRECILLGFTEPTKYYDGKFPDDHWDYWENGESKTKVSFFNKDMSAKFLISKGHKPLTKFYYNDWVGNMIFGVIITDDEIKSLPKGKKFNIHNVQLNCNDTYKVLEVGECSGFDDELRAELSHYDYVGKVIEVKCNEIFKDTGKLRHPRFLRFRDDKDPEDCTYSNHINE